MMKKIKIIGLVSVILISLIGIPSVKHFCNMMEISKDSDCELICNTCSHSQNEIESCCSMETESSISDLVISVNDECCSDEFTIKKIDDEFIINKVESSHKISQTERALDNHLIFELKYLSFSKSHSKDASPRLKTETEVYILFHSLLI